jgi:predicted enzyme related to lactoylglutathione lyase
MNRSWIILPIWLFASCEQKHFQEETLIDNTATMADNDTLGRVIGIGGIFFKSKDPKAQREWYQQNLGLVTNEYGSLFEFCEGSNPDQKGYLQWSPFDEKTKYFAPSEREFMINYRVKNMEALVKQLEAAGVTICDSIEEYEYGKFVHIMDPEGNKIELWEPVDESFTESQPEGTTTK